MLWEPIKIGIAGILLWMFIWISSPLTVVNPLDINAVFFMGLGFLSFFVGCFIAGGLRRNQGGDEFRWESSINIRGIGVTAFIGLVGMAARYYDRSVIRGVDYSQNSAEVREALIQASASIWGIVGSILFPFCFLPFIYILISKWNRSTIAIAAATLIIFMLPMLESLAQLSRSIMLMTAVLLFVAIGCLKFQGNPFQRRLLYPAIGGSIILIFASSLILSARLQDSERDLRDSVVESVYAENVTPSARALDGLVAGSRLESRFYEAVLPNAMYYLSGAYEFTLLWTRPDEQPFAYGQYMFSPVAKGVNILLAESNPTEMDEELLVYRIGVFNSFFGPVWIDFGWLGLLFCAAFGYAVQKIAGSARSGNFSILPLYFYSVVIVFYMPVVNFITTGYGFFAIVSFGLFGIVVNRRGAFGNYGPSMSGQKGYI